MDTDRGFWIALIVGGLLIAALSAGQQYMMNDPKNPYSEFKVKPVIRDFFIGAFLSSVIYMLIPDSIQQLFASIKSASSGEVNDIELQTGPARF
jgi:hypothetical protein